MPASGFQSLQFRKIETLLGLQMEKRSKYQQNVFKAYLSEKDIADLEKTEKSTTLFHAIEVRTSDGDVDDDDDADDAEFFSFSSLFRVFSLFLCPFSPFPAMA